MVVEELTRGRYLRLLSGVYLAMFLIRVAFGIVIITFGHYVTAGDALFGLLVASAPAAEVITVVFAGFVVDRYGRKGVLLAGLGLGAASLYALALAERDGIWLIGFAQALHGIAAGFILVTTLAIIAAYAAPQHRGREMGLFNFVNMFGWFAGFALGTVLLDAVSDLRITFILAGALATAGLAYGHFAVKEPPRNAEVERLTFSTFTAVLRNPRVLVLSAAWLMVFLFVGGLISFFSRIIVPEDAATEVVEGAARGTRVALVIVGVGLLLVVSQLVFGWLADHWGRERVMLLGGVGYISFIATIMVGVDLTNGFTITVPGTGFVLLVTSFVTLAFGPAALAALADEATERTEGTTMSAYSIVLNIGFIASPVVVGVLREFGGMGAVLVFYLITSALLTLLVVVRIKQVQDDAPVAAVASSHPPSE